MELQDSCLIIREMLGASLRDCMSSLGARSGSVFVLDEPANELVLQVVKTQRDVEIEGVRVRLGEGVAGSVAASRKPLLVCDAPAHYAQLQAQPAGQYRSHSFLSLPLEYDETLIGVLNLTDKEAGPRFTGDDLGRAVTVCRSLGMAVYTLRQCLTRQGQMHQRHTHEIQELRRSLAQAQQFSALGKIVGGIVHEINNPLDGVMRYVNLASSSLPENDSAKEYLTEAQSGLARIAHTVHSLLDFSWSLASRQGRADINRIIEESVFMMRPLLTARAITIEKNIAPGLPKTFDYRLKVVLNNFIKNACDAMPSGGTISFAVTTDGTWAEITCTDTGAGVPADMMDKIFEPFFTTKNMGEGSGLGLAISTEIVHRCNGMLRVQNAPGKGAMFSVTVPLAGQEEQDE